MSLALAFLLATNTPDSTLILANREVRARWTVAGNSLRPLDLTDLRSGRTIKLGANDFSITLSDETFNSRDLQLQGKPIFEGLKRQSNDPKFSNRIGGKSLTFALQGRGFKATLKAVLRDGSRYLREELSVQAEGQDLPVKRITMIDLSAPELAVAGGVQGSPLASDTAFAAVEDPLSRSQAENGEAAAWIDRKLPVRAGQSATESSVIGFTDEGQLRRTFLAYLERERAHPYRTFLHYNSWYDIGYFTPYNEQDCTGAINAFGHELVEKRGVKMSSFLFDDGWDDTSTVWEFHKGFPNGFYPVKAAAEKYHADPGIWLSPWGGYSTPHERRIATGKAKGYEVDSQGYALSGPKYFERFKQVTLDLVSKYGINQFKFDGTGSPDKQYPGSAFGSDFEAAISLIQSLREAKPSLFINLTTGTWPSPFWTRYADSIWRGGSDHSFAGVGSYRQRWITYRDGDTYRGVVSRGPLYPLNSLMLHGIIYAQHAIHLDTDPGNDFKSEVRDYFGTGTQLQEMYITPRLLTQQNWDDLAEAANWSRANADVLVDNHWIGGDPRRLEAYGWASWNRRKGIITLRNPSDKPLSFSLDLEKAFELPAGAARRFMLKSPWKDEAGEPAVTTDADKPVTIELRPFQVMTLETAPRSG